MTSAKKLLVVDDDKRIRTLLSEYLQAQGYKVTTAHSARVAEDFLKTTTYDCMILDIMMPDEDGITFVKRLRESSDAKFRMLPVVMLTALGDVDQRISGLESGADDYLAKPFEPRELVLRLEKLIARVKRAPADRSGAEFVKMGELIYDMQARQLTCGNDIIYLTSTELDLLDTLAHESQNVLSREDIAGRMGFTLSPRSIDVQVTRLRKKIEDNPAQPKYIKTVRHKGYGLWPS